MGYLLSTFWFWLLLAALLGLAVGWMSCAKNDARGWGGLLPWGLALGVGGGVALLQVLPQRLGFWLEIGLLMLGAYVLGCCIGCFVRRGQGTSEVTMPAAAVAKAVPPATVSKPAPEPVMAAVVGELAVEPAKTAEEPASIEAIEQAITGLSAPRGGKGDDLTKIYGVDPEIQSKLNQLGLYHYDQIASLSPGNRRWLFRQLGHEGRFPSWWWRWRYDAEQLAAGKTTTHGNAVAAGALAAPAPAKKARAKTATPAPVAAIVEAGPVAEDGFEGTKPAVLTGPRDGKGDDLKRIAGIGKQNEGRLHGLGVWHFDQIAGWSAEEVKWVGGYLAFPGRIEREDWIAQAKVLASGEATEFSKRADAGKVATSRDETNDDGQKNVVTPVKKPKAPKA